jgi:signal transduction histidine kinase
VRQLHIFLFFYQVLTGVLCLFLPGGARSPVDIAVAGLTIVCLLGVRMLLALAGRFSRLQILLSALALGLALYLELYPFACLIIVTACDAVIPLSAACVGLLTRIYGPALDSVLIMPLVTVPVLFIEKIFTRVTQTDARLEAVSEENGNLRRQLDSQRRFNLTAEHAARLNERSRLSARIHDRIGHGISGSILLLEGARLNLDTNPSQAKAALETATDNLRASVDDIRAALRQERPAAEEAGLSAIDTLLNEFGVSHPRFRTGLVTSGDMSVISSQIWICVRDNLTEALTNLLKHSAATAFEVSVSVKNKLVTVSFKDNGPCTDFKPGIGLTAMEERCALCRGNCFITAGNEGFSIVMTFLHSMRSV